MSDFREHKTTNDFTHSYAYWCAHFCIFAYIRPLDLLLAINSFCLIIRMPEAHWTFNSMHFFLRHKNLNWNSFITYFGHLCTHFGFTRFDLSFLRVFMEQIFFFASSALSETNVYIINGILFIIHMKEQKKFLNNNIAMVHFHYGKSGFCSAAFSKFETIFIRT